MPLQNPDPAVTGAAIQRWRRRPGDRRRRVLLVRCVFVCAGAFALPQALLATVTCVFSYLLFTYRSCAGGNLWINDVVLVTIVPIFSRQALWTLGACCALLTRLVNTLLPVVALFAGDLYYLCRREDDDVGGGVGCSFYGNLTLA